MYENVENIASIVLIFTEFGKNIFNLIKTRCLVAINIFYFNLNPYKSQSQ